MNKIYRVVWNKETNTWTAVCEYAKSKGKSSSSSGVVGTLSNGVFTAVRFTYTALVSALILVSGQAMAVVTGASSPTGDSRYCLYDATSQSVVCGDGTTSTVDTVDGKKPKAVVIGLGATNTGESNVAVGISASSAGTSSVAVGDRAKAGSDQSIAVGQNAQANARWDVSIGRQAGWNATAPAGTNPEGRNIAIGDAALKNGLDVNNNNVMGTSAGENLKGSHNIIIGTYANTAEAIQSAKNAGSNDSQINFKTRTVNVIDGGTKEVNHVETSNSVAIGHRALTTKTAGVAIGQQAKAFGTTSSAVGNGSRALGDNSVAMGNTANAGAAGAIAIGQQANYQPSVKGNGTDQNPEIPATYKTSGTNSIAIGVRTHSEATHSITMGTDSIVKAATVSGGKVRDKAGNEFSTAVTGATLTGVGSVAIGAGSVSNGVNSVALGQASEALGQNTFAGGNDAHARGKSSVAIGDGANSNNDSAVALGYAANVAEKGLEAYWDAATKSYMTRDSASAGAVAVGSNAKAQGYGSVAVGRFSETIFMNATAVGNESKALGYNSTAVGFQSMAKGVSSIAIGDKALAGTQDAGTHIPGANRGVAIGVNSNATGETAVTIGSNADVRVSRGTALGVLSQVTQQDGVALGANSVANRDKNMIGADPLNAKNSTAPAHVWTATHAAVSVGNNTKHTGQRQGNSTGVATWEIPVVTRQITNVAAGTEDTDAVNVAQLKAAGFVLATTADTQAGGTANDSTPTDATGAADKKIINGETLTLKAGKGVDLKQNGAEVTISTTLESADKTHYYSVKTTDTTATSNYNNDGAEGLDSLAAGVRTKAVKKNAVAVGSDAVAVGSESLAIGNNVIAGALLPKPNSSDPDKADTNVDVVGATAVGNNSRATATGAQAFGQSSKATAENAAAIGRLATASGARASAFGVGNTASGASSFAGGDKSVATGANSIAVGLEAKSTHDNTIAIGKDAKAQIEDSIAIGRGVTTEILPADDALANNGVGNREGMIAIGSETTKASGKAAISIGRNAQGIGRGTVALGDASKSLAGQGVAIGAQANIANAAAGGIAIGSLAKAEKHVAIAIGSEAQAKGDKSVAVGSQTIVDSAKGVAVGYGAKAEGAETANIAIGDSAYTNASGALAIGIGASAKGLDVVTTNNQGVPTNDKAKPYNAIAIGNGANVDTLAAGANGVQERSTDAIAIGTNAKANYASTIAIGYGAKANTKSSATAIGLNSDAQGWKSLAVGVGAVAKQTDSVALGSDSVADTGINQIGADPLNAQADKNSHAWKSTKAAVSVGNVAGGITRQITSVAAGTQDTDAVNVAQLKVAGFKLTTSKSDGEVFGSAEEKVKNGDTVTIDAGKNIKVTQTGSKVSIATKDDVNFNSVTIGNSGVRLTGNGLDNGGKKITNVLDGDSATDAVNLGQLQAAIKNVNVTNATNVQANSPFSYVNSQGEQLIRHPNGTFTKANDGSPYQGTDISIAALNSVAPQAVTPTQVGNIKAGVKDTDAVNVSQLKGVVTALGGGTSINADGTITVPSYTITKTDGTTHPVANSVGDALSNLNAEVVKPITFSGDTGTAFERKLGQTTAIKGGITDENKLSNSNIGVVAKDGTLDIKLAKDIDLGNDGGVTTGGVQVNNEGLTIIDGPSITKSNGINAGNKVIADVASNLPTTQNNTAIQGIPSNATKAQVAPNNADAIKNNAATVGDVLNAGWNVQTNGSDTDFVRVYDTVNFADGVGTTITSETDGNKTTFKVNVNAQGLAESAQLPVVYTDGFGNKVYKHTDGKFYDEPNGQGDQIAPGDIVATMQAADGSVVKPTSLTNVAAGANDTDAVNVSQLKGAVTALGGGAQVNLDGSFKAPTYTLTDGDPSLGNTTTYHNVGDALAGLNTAVNQSLSFSGDAGDAFDRKLGSAIKVTGGVTESTKLTDNNIGVVADRGTLAVKLAKDIVIDSVTTGNTTVNNEGVTIKAPTNGGTTDVKLTANGLNNGGNKITNVAKGTITTDSKDAINGSQLRNTAGDIATIIGGNAKVDDEGNVTASDIGGTGKATIDEAIKASKTTVSSNDSSIKVTKTTSQTTGADNYDISVNAQGLAESAQLPVVYTNTNGDKLYLVEKDDPSAPGTKIKVFNTKPDGKGEDVDPPNVIASMQNAASDTKYPMTLTNVATGVRANDAVNVSQLGTAGIYETTQNGDIVLENGAPKLKGLNFAGNDGKGNTKLGDTWNIVGGNAGTATTDPRTFTDGTFSGGNIKTTVKDGVVEITMADSPKFGDIVINNQGKITGIANGDIIATSKDAINGSQLRNTAGDIATIIGGNANVDDAGNVTASDIGGTGQSNIHDAIKTVKTTVKSTDNSIKVTANPADAINGTVFDISVNAQGLAESAQLPVVYTKVDGTKVYKVGNKFFDNKEGTGTEIEATNIIASMQNADGTITPTTLANIKAGTKDTDAVNVSQLKGVADTLGGDASINADGTINAPTYNITNPADGVAIKAQNVGDALNALNTAVNNPLTFAGDTGLFNRNLGQTTTIKGGVTDENKLSNSNIGVVAKDGALDIKLAKDIAIDSVTTGNTTVNNDGITIKTPANGGTTDVKLTANGLNNGGNKITNVAKGTVDTDAVNFAQLKEVQKTAKAAKTEVQAGNNMAVTYSTGTNGQTIYNVATKPDVLFDSVTVGTTGTNQVVLDDTGVKVGGNTYISGTGLNANNKKVTNVAKGDVSANSKDAINGSQLYAHGEGVKNIIGGNTTYDPATGAYTNADIGGTGKGNIHDAIASINTTANAGWNVQTNAGNKTNVKPSDTVNFIDGSNIKITNDGTNITVATADDLTVNSVTAGNTVVNNAGVKVGDVQITAGGINAGNQQITNLKSGLNGKTLDDIKADTSAPERSNAATIGDLATVQNNVTNITHNYNTVIGGSSADGKVLDSQGNVVTDNQGNSIDVVDALKTYNVQDNKAKTDNTIITAIKNMNEGGIKFFHVNDGTGEQNIAGTDTHKEDSTASGKFAAAVGYEAQSTGENALAFGKGSQALAKNAIAIGTGNIVRGENSGAIGDPSIINGANSYSVGNNNTVTTDKTFVLGNEVKQTVADSVFLGDKSSSAGIHTKAKGEHYTYAGANDANVAGVSGSSAPVGVVSVGTEGGQTRQIQNVAAGVVSANSTDAINGSQLYYTNEAITNVANNTINMGNQLNNRINDVADDANAGVSSAMAMASLPQAYLPGKSMITGGVASYNGEGAVAVGLSKLSDNGRWVLKISGSADTQGNAGGSIGAGFHF